MLALSLIVLVGALVLPSRVREQPEAQSAAPVATPTEAGDADTPVSPEQAVGSPFLPGSDEPPNGDFFWLYDVSLSVAPVRNGSGQVASASGTSSGSGPSGTAGNSPFERSVELLVPGLEAVRSMEELLPIRTRVGTIGTLSLRQRPVCDISMDAPTLFRGQDTMAVVRAMRACEHELRVLPREQYTDIRGALAYAALTLQGTRPAMRGVILLSDLVEDLPSGHAPAHPNLENLCLAVYAQVTDEAARQPGAFMERQQRWSDSLDAWGARDVLMSSTIGFNTAELITFIRECTRR